MVTDELLQKLREIRSLPNVSLKPSPYLRKSYTNEYGEEKDVILRNYQSQMILNLSMMERMICADDTGLGKTIMTLSTIGYVWLKEPTYVPIIITTKTSLFQWASEIKKFMKDMEAVVVHGNATKRHSTYENFFESYDPNKKRLLIMTYDHVMYDAEASVISDKATNLRKGFAKELKAAKDWKKETEEDFQKVLEVYRSQFHDQRSYDVAQYVEACLQEGPSGLAKPYGWSDQDQEILRDFIQAKDKRSQAVSQLDSLKREANPPKKVPGIHNLLDMFLESHPDSKLMLVMDEIHKLKNHKSQFHTKCFGISSKSKRVIGMTATPVKNKLMEFFGIFHIIKPDLFPKITHFQNEYCVTKMQRIAGGRQVPIVIGYKNLDKFIKVIEPYYFSRKKHDVAEELPELISCEIECELYELQTELYDFAEAGLLSTSDDPDTSSSDLLSSMTMCQQAVDSPRLLLNEIGEPYDGPSSKIDQLIEFLEGDANDQKTIVFSKFEKMVSAIGEVLKEKKIPYVRITGKENDPKYREAAKNKFQDPKSDVNVILITTAGAESINLQAAQHFVFVDLPWSWGDYVQLIGRMVRIGSSHNTVVAHHLLGRKPNGGKTIDHHVLKALRGKMKLANKVAGESLKGGLTFQDPQDSVRDILESLRSDSGSNDPKLDPKKPVQSDKIGNVTSKKKPTKKTVDRVEEDHPIINTNIDFSDI